VTVAFNTNQPEIAKTAEIIRDNWNAIGVAVTLRPLDFAGSNKLEADWGYDVHIGQYSCGPDPAIGVARLYVSGNIKNAPGVNTMGYANPQVDDLFQRAERELDRGRRAALYREVHRLLAREVPAVFVWDWGLPIVYREEWADLVPVTFVQDQHLEEVHRRPRP
jgi:peptide/nickel transport system substrate-binding protein